MAFNSITAYETDYKTFLNKFEDEFKKMGCATRVEIKDLFSNNSEEKYTEEDLAKLDYKTEEILDMKAGNWGLQLWKKMIVRFNNCDCDAATMWNQLSPNYRQLLLNKYKIMDYYNIKNPNIQYYVMNFFVWVSCSLAFYSVKDMFQSEEIADKWDKMTSITWYFSLKGEQQDTLIMEYKKYLVSYM